MGLGISCDFFIARWCTNMLVRKLVLELPGNAICLEKQMWLRIWART